LNANEGTRMLWYETTNMVSQGSQLVYQKRRQTQLLRNLVLCLFFLTPFWSSTQLVPGIFSHTKLVSNRTRSPISLLPRTLSLAS